MADLNLSDRVLNIPEALSIYFNQLVYDEKRKGMDIITLSLGEAFFHIPHFEVDDVDFIKGYHYSDSLGLPQLRYKILEYYRKHYNSEVNDINQVMISSGSKVIIYMVILALCNKNDEVLIHEPAWLSYKEQVQLTGAYVKSLPYDVQVDKFVEYMSYNTKLIILNNPNNPAGLIYEKKQLFRLCDICRERGIYILMDEAYSDFVLEDKAFASLANVKSLDNVFVVNSLSKNMGMSGWRIGYVISSPHNISNLMKLNQHLITCAPTILQSYIAKNFDRIIEITLPQVKAIVERRNRVVNYIKEKGLDCLSGTATFYIFLRIDNISVNVLDFCLYLLFKYGISCVPGQAYGKSTVDFIRIGVGAESEERIRYAIDVIKNVIVNDSVNIEYINEKLKENDIYRFGDEKV